MPLQGSSASCIYIGSCDPVRVLRLSHNKYTGYTLKYLLLRHVVVPAGSMLAGPTIFPNYNMWSLWQPHKLLWPNSSLQLRSCKWPPLWSPFASPLVTDWHQSFRCPSRMCVVPLYKRAGLPSPWLTFWLNVTSGTSRSKVRNLTLTLARLLVHSTHLVDLSVHPLTSRSWRPMQTLVITHMASTRFHFQQL